jgi:cytochrome c biogenesis protein CcdA
VGLIGLSAWTYAIVAASLTVAALAGLIRARVTACEQHQQARQSRSTGGIFLLGASSVMVFSPCCTPLVSAIGTSAGAFGGPLSAAGLLAVYGLGHGLPAALLALGVGSLAAPLRALALHQASAIAGNAILLVLAGYYWCLV